ncbi:MAG: peptidylprolyl isomerase [Clostridia bacterium]|nr:peptidylprolyl isomerase [Clostridia bacterium]
MKKLICVFLILSVFLAEGMLSACGERPAEPSSSSSDPAPVDPAPSAPPSDPAATLDEWERTYTAGDFGIVNRDDPFVVLEIEGYGDIRIELFPQVAPITVENFLSYVEDGFYDGVVFHRVIASFMIQAGGFEEQNGLAVQKGATYPTIKGEFAYNGVANYLGHFPGVLSMARYGDGLDEEGNIVEPRFDTASSQFFICTARDYSLDGLYAAFGRVVDEESMATALAIERVQTTTTYLYYGSTPVASRDVPTTLPKVARAWVVKRGSAALAD